MCPAASWGYVFFQPFPFPLPLLKFVSFYLAQFSFQSKPKAFQRISFSQAKKTWMIMIHNSMVCLEGTLLCPAAFLRSWFFFQSFPLPFPLLAKVFSFQLIYFLVSFIWNSQKWLVSQNIWCLIKTQLKNVTQTIFQGGSPWATLIHNSVVCLEGTLLCPAASWGHDFLIFFNHFLYLFLC